MFHLLKHPIRHICSKQFLAYLISGTSANVIDLGLFYALEWWGVYYVTASVVGGVVGFLTAFVLHKYAVFGKRGKHGMHFARFCTLGAFNLLATNAILYMLVEGVGIPEELAKIPANGSVVLWNFFVFKFLVYV